MSFTIRKVMKATEEEIQKTAEVAAVAFLNDPFATVATRNDLKLGVAWARGGIISGAMGGEIYVAESEEGEIVGVAVGFPPGRSLYDSEEQLAAGKAPFMAACPEDLRLWWTEYFIPEVSAFTDAEIGSEVKQKSWCLFLLSVAPGHQRKGIARALYHKFSEKANAAGTSLYLDTHTDQNRRMYEKFGMTIKGASKTFQGLEVLSTIDFSSDSMSSDILLDFGSFDLDDDEDALQTRIDRMRAAFLHSRKTYGTSERIYTEPGWYDPPKIPPPTKLHVRNIDYSLNSLFLRHKYREALELAISQLETEQDHDGKEGRERELLDLAMRCAKNLKDEPLLGILADRSKRRWSAAPGLASMAAEAYLLAFRPRDALSAILAAIKSRGTFPPYLSLLTRALESLTSEMSNAEGTEALQSILALVRLHVRPFRPMFPEIGSDLESATYNAASILSEDTSTPAHVPDSLTATSWSRASGIGGVDQETLVTLLCHRRNPSEEQQEFEGTSVRAL